MRAPGGAFREEFVLGGGFPQEVFAEAPRTQNLRWAADYEAEEFTAEEAAAVIAAAKRFVAEAEAAVG